ncbi:MAG: hypothetical protein CBE43_07990 [Rhodopirellula sp. TMED283]|nr:MAG: hypothetical protein CBE43_07990 [Rhodopirellula sp. TMED283]
MNQTFLSYSNLANGHRLSIRPVNLGKYIVWASVGLYLKLPNVTSWQDSREWAGSYARLIFTIRQLGPKNRRLMLGSIFCHHSVPSPHYPAKNKIREHSRDGF